MHHVLLDNGEKQMVQGLVTVCQRIETNFLCVTFVALLGSESDTYRRQEKNMNFRRLPTDPHHRESCCDSHTIWHGGYGGGFHTV